MLIARLLLHINDTIIGLSYIWIAIEIVRLIGSSKIVKKIKLNPELSSLHLKIILHTICFSLTFFTCGLTHVSARSLSKFVIRISISDKFCMYIVINQIFNVLVFMLLDNYPLIFTISLVVHYLSMVSGVATAILLSICIPGMLAATDFLEVTPEGSLRDAEATLLDVVDNCKESVAMLLLPELTFQRGNKSTCLYFGDYYLDAKIVDFIFEADRTVFLKCISDILEKERAESAEGVGCVDSDAAVDVSLRYAFGLPRTSCIEEKRDDDEDVDEESPLVSPTVPTTGDQSINVEYRVYDAQNELIWLESTVLLHKESKNDGEIVTMMMLMTRNIHVKKTKEEIVKRENETKLQYITCCAHDLKTPLQSFSSALDLLMASGLNTDQQDICKQAEVSSSLMGLTIAQTMDTSKVLMVSIVFL
jgi:hypothetical protein